jgi:hypothetical protein
MAGLTDDPAWTHFDVIRSFEQNRSAPVQWLLRLAIRIVSVVLCIGAIVCQRSVLCAGAAHLGCAKIDIFGTARGLCGRLRPRIPASTNEQEDVVPTRHSSFVDAVYHLANAAMSRRRLVYCCLVYCCHVRMPDYY